ncbi:uncharacterized protein [Physcomitrium patens]|uniref:uncharacterized protein n=1 Tax=Physcomitrium patens TaxID=3218 RepID=UPI003CCD78F2
MKSSSNRAMNAEILAKSLQQENDILRFQLNDLINREQNQRLELQRLRAHREVEMTSLVNASTNKLKCEVERLKAQLEPASASRAEAAAEKERILREKEQLVTEIKGLRKKIVDEEQTCGGRLRSLGSVVAKCTCIATSIVQSVDAFQRHVLPNFRVVEDQKNPEEKSQRINFDSDGSQKLIDEMHKLEAGVALLRVIVDAKNDTLVLIRGKLIQENDELKADLAAAREKMSAVLLQAASDPEKKTGAIGSNPENEVLRQEIHALQDLYSAKIEQMQSTLKLYEQADTDRSIKHDQLRQEIQSLHHHITTIEASRHRLEDDLKYETSARSQLVTEIYHMRKENEALGSEIEMLKLNQKFFRGHARKGRLPMEKMDMVNTVNQLMIDNSKLRSDKAAVEEELKTQRRTNVLERVKSVVTARDVALCANNKVGDSELASKLARIRLQHLGMYSPTQLPLTNGNPCLSTATANLFLPAADNPDDSTPAEDPSRRPFVPPATKPKKLSDMFDGGLKGFAQLAGLKDRGII